MAARIPVAVVGAGRVAQAVHLPLLAGSADFRVTAVVEPDPGRAELAARRCPDAITGPGLELVRRSGARAALVATPWPSHAEVVGQLLGDGVPVLCEKPVSLDEAELAGLARLQAAAGVPVLVGYMKRHDETVRRFLEVGAELAGSARALTVRVADPNSPHQVAHLLPAELAGGRPPTSQQAERALDRILGPAVGATTRAAYAHGLGGSLVHQVNLVHALLGHRLLGRLQAAAQWAGGTAVSCSWLPSEHAAVQATHVRLPGHGRYREEIELLAERHRVTLRLPSPYQRDAGGVLQVESWARAGAVGGSYRTEARPGETGFAGQLRAWAGQLRGGTDGPRPGLDEALRDLQVLREAADRLPAGAGGRHPAAVAAGGRAGGPA
jgi:predicted dehydrogenase